MVDKNVVEDFLRAIQTPQKNVDHTYNATVTRIDDTGIVWVQLAGSDKETPTASTSSEVKMGDSVNVQWRNNKLYIAGNYSNPAAGSIRVNAVEMAAQVANQAATNAVADAGVARQAAEDAQATADTVHEIADNASQYAARAYGNLATLQSVAETLTWITQHGTMTLTTDVALDPTHVYFVQDAGGDYVVGGVTYAIVTEPKVDDIGTYYVLSIDESLNNYVGTHLALTGEGLWLIPEAGGNKVLVATGSGSTYTDAGTFIIDSNNTILAQFLESEVKIGSNSNSTLSLDNDSITAYGENGKTFFNVAGDGAQINTWYNIDKVKVTQVGELVDGMEFIHSDSEFVDSIKIHVTTDVNVTTPGGSQILVAFPSSEFNYGTSSTDTHSYNHDGVIFNILIKYTSPSTFEISFDSVSYVDSVDISISKLKNANAPIYDFGQDNGVTGAFSMVVGATNHSAGNYSFASGYNCFADGFASFAHGGYSHANGNESHAEGFLTTANGAYSHASGDSTHANMKAQTVVGTYNIDDTEPSIAVHPNGQTDYGNYAFIVGNGKNGARSNALTVDWTGNITVNNHDSEIGHVYSASTSVAISNTAIDNNTDGASLTLSAGVYIVIGQWQFNTRSTSGTTNSAIRLYRSGSGDNIAQTRVMAGDSNWNSLQCTAIVELASTETVKVCGATSRPYTTAQGTYITAVRIK